MRQASLPGFARIAFLSVLIGRGASAGPTRMTWTVGGERREALVFAPAGDVSARKLPVLLAFHGHGGNMEGASLGMRFQSAWPEAIVVYPQGLATRTKIDPRGLRPGWQREPGQDGDRDLKLVDAILATLREKYPVDDTRIYAAGFSNGGFFSYLLWATRGKVFAAFGVCAGLVEPGFVPPEPRPVIHIGGESDRIVVFGDQKETIRTVLRWNGCSGAGDACGTGCVRYASSKGAPVVVVTHPGGHVFPAWAGEKIVTFFRNHPGSASPSKSYASR